MEPDPSKSCHQKRMGPAPFASFEDLSDEVRSRMDSPGEKEISVIRLPGISEQDVPVTPSPDDSRTKHQGVSLIGATLKTSSNRSSSNSLAHSPLPNKMKLANTPRIDISRASSSSHHDSKDSTPEREMFEGSDPQVKLGLGFKEDDALELRLSTEELDFQDVAETKSHKYKHRSASPEFDELHYDNNRKDSTCSDVILLSISGRTSRLSSIGSQGSAQSRLSNASHISVASNHSAYSQCSSPHKTLLETSFCGYKGSQSNVASEADSKEDEDLEKVVLSRKPNPTQVILADTLKLKKIEKQQSRPKSAAAVRQNPESSKTDLEEERPKLPRKIISKSGVEYIYIPLKGPLPRDVSQERSEKRGRAEKPTAVKDVRSRSHGPSSAPVTSRHTTDPVYIRIRLKPDHMYDDYDPNAPSTSISKTANLTLPLRSENGTTKVNEDDNFNSIKSHARSLTNSPKLLRKEMGGLSPALSVPRRNSFATLFRAGPESPGTTKQKRKIIGCVSAPGSGRARSAEHQKTTHSVSSTESVDSKGKHKSVLSLLKFSKEKSKSNDNTPEKHKPKPSELQKKEKLLAGESMRIPLHSPEYYENRNLLQELQMSSQDSQITVVEVVPQPKSKVSTPISEKSVTKAEVEPPPKCDKAVEEKEILDTRLQIECDSDPVAPIVESNTVITTVAKVELTKIPEDVSSHSLNSSKEAKELAGSSRSIVCMHSYEDHNSSESERDVELSEYRKCDKPLLPGTETEHKAIVLQQDSFEDELPYVPTTLPQERSAAIPILPVKQRCVMDMKTCPIDRPRSTTPIHSSGIETYFDGFGTKYDTPTSEKLKISLPESTGKVKVAETTVTSSADYRKAKEKDDVPPPLPPKGVQKSWINFEEVPERRKPPKRIQTIPPRGQIDITGLVKDNVVYTYVNPEECKCECHEHKEAEKVVVQDDEVPLLTGDEKELSLDR